eukprot:5049090-Prymnesium_polylepis.1
MHTCSSISKQSSFARAVERASAAAATAAASCALSPSARAAEASRCARCVSVDADSRRTMVRVRSRSPLAACAASRAAWALASPCASVRALAKAPSSS